MATSLGGERPRNRDQVAPEPLQEIDAGEAGPLAVRLDQLGRLPRLDPPAAHRREQLHEPEVADEPALVPAEALEADDADRPRADPRLAREPRGCGVRRHSAQTFELKRAAETDEGAGPRAAETERPQLRG